MGINQCSTSALFLFFSRQVIYQPHSRVVKCLTADPGGRDFDPAGPILSWRLIIK